MEHFVVSARKYRPQTFKDVVGQQAITNTLLNAIENNHLAQALLFCGPRGVGKTTCARILAKKINEDGSQHSEEDFAFNVFELDAASNNSVDGIRSLIDQVRIPPQVGKYKVYIIDEVHMLSTAAFNAFLKTLEEPPKHAIFILATTEKHKIIPTILSRCQIFDFKRITVTDAKDYLKYIAEQQGIIAEDDALHIIAQKADGAMRDALSIFDRIVSFCGNNITRKAVSENLNVLDYDTYFVITDLILENNIPQLLIEFNNTLAKGFDGHHFIAGLASHFRDLMVCKNEATISLLEVGEDTQQRYLQQSRNTTLDFLIKGIELANTCDLQYKASKNQRLLVELCLMQLASVTYDGEKKNDGPFIIPATFFRQVTIQKEVIQQRQTSASKEISIPTNIPVENTPQPVLNSTSNVSQPRISGLSLSSLKIKKDAEKRKAEQVPDEENLPKEEFTEASFMELWAAYIKQIEDEGKHILASNLSADTPVLENKTTICLEMPNSTMKAEIEREQYGLLDYLRKNLQNYDISLHIKVNETIDKKYAFTTREKFEKLVEANPLMEVFRKEFDLEI
ncbi:DNA polymerase III subunit gamma/tau [Imtechella halotolerans]|uniref:DNA polymerase III subunit gamma/tau n=1 Tax=Imtechella halotolerans K1 TaxID=946077 RepID=I0WAV1_9FLAO|nr:DNA polymerase III subunit gamma/tau [Imtechella halotolerans]EID73517.1 DNA polymerase III subunits gamma and tau [Imtechella halotolerans K1]WMQ63718.1 DNA polymerase III subunit gamma/tau [Imtechella halotolerans]